MSRLNFILAGVIALVAAASTAPAQAATPSCAVHGRTIAHLSHSQVVSTSGALVVYRVRGSQWDTLWACERGSRARSLVGRDDSFQSDGEYSPSLIVSNIHLAGPWVLATIETGADSYDACTKYAEPEAPPCIGPEESLELVNAATPARLDISRIVLNSTTASGSSVATQWLRTALSPIGAVAWLTSVSTTPAGFASSSAAINTLWGCRVGGSAKSTSCPATTLASGAVAPDSLAFSGATLSWTLGGQPHSAALT